MTIGRTALLGAWTLYGTDLLERLGRERSRLGSLALVDPDADAVTARPVAGEWVVAGAGLEESLDGADLVLCCGRLDETTAARVRAAASSATVLDLAGSLDGQPVESTAPGGISRLGHGIFASPCASSSLVAMLERAARRAGAASPGAAVVCEPASELSKAAVTELHAQTVALLNFSPLPVEVFGRQAVHDVTSPGTGGASSETRIRREVAALAGPVAVLVLQPGLFHGVGVAFRTDAEAGAMRRALEQEARLELRLDDADASPAGAVAGETAIVGRITPDGAGTWTWAVADSLAQGAVGTAVSLIRNSGE